MSEVGECSYSYSCWGKLVATCSEIEIELKMDETVVMSESGNEWCKIIRNSDSEMCCATLDNISHLPIKVDDALINTRQTALLYCGTHITHGGLSYTFQLLIPKGKAVSPTIPIPNQLKICVDVDNAKCSICLSVWHDVVTLAPCFHNFCNGCFSEWLKRSQHKHSNVLCPQCRALVHFAGRNHFLHNIGHELLKADSSLKRSFEEIATLDSSASIQSTLVLKTGKGIRRKRAHSPLDEESQSADHTCPQCASEFGGFRCSQTTIHLQCHACGGLMPSRSLDTPVPQHCLGCDRAYCGAYWHSQGMGRSDSHATCSRENFKPVSEHTISRIPFCAHEKNRHERDITESCIRQMDKTLQDVVAEWIAKLNNREIDRSRMPLNHAEMITAGTCLCNECYEKLVSFLLYWYRISIPKYLLGGEASGREDCWYGYTCRTQHHNHQHARRRNHVCRPTRASNTSSSS